MFNWFNFISKTHVFLLQKPYVFLLECNSFFQNFERFSICSWSILCIYINMACICIPQSSWFWDPVKKNRYSSTSTHPLKFKSNLHCDNTGSVWWTVFCICYRGLHSHILYRNIRNSTCITAFKWFILITIWNFNVST